LDRKKLVKWRQIVCVGVLLAGLIFRSPLARKLLLSGSLIIGSKGFYPFGLLIRIAGFENPLFTYNLNNQLLQQNARQRTSLMRDRTFSRVAAESSHFPWALQACAWHLSNISSSDFDRTVKSQLCLKSLHPNSFSLFISRAMIPTPFHLHL
jgi:hypothetical protein